MYYFFVKKIFFLIQIIYSCFFDRLLKSKAQNKNKTLTMNAEQQEKIAQFCGVTGESAERAKFFLDANGFEVGAAIEMFYSQGEEPMQAEEQPADNQPPPVSASAPQAAQAPANPPAAKSNIFLLFFFNYVNL